MSSNLTITFKNMEKTDLTTQAVEERFNKIRQISSNIIRCHVVISVPHRRHRLGNDYQVKISLVVPGHELIGQSRNKRGNGDLYCAISDAFTSISSQLKGISSAHSQKAVSNKEYYTLLQAYSLAS